MTYDVSFVAGDGRGGSEIKISDATGQACVNDCVERKKTDTRINGVTIRSNGQGGCWCERGMTYVASSRTYNTGYLREKSELITLLLYLHISVRRV